VNRFEFNLLDVDSDAPNPQHRAASEVQQVDFRSVLRRKPIS